MAALITLSTVRVAKIKDAVKNLLDANFGATLAREPDILNIAAALIHKESRFNVNAIGPAVSTERGTGGFAFVTSSAIIRIYNEGNTTQQSNLALAFRGLGLMQCMGWNFIKGGSPTGVCELDRLRPDLSGSLVVNPGDDLSSIVLGEGNIEKAILAGLIILEGKWRIVQSAGDYFYIKVDPYKRKFPSRIAGAVAAYLGLGRKDLNNTTPEQYALSILGGQDYVLANGGNSYKIYDSEVKTASSRGPSTNGANYSRITVAGCTLKANAG